MGEKGPGVLAGDKDLDERDLSNPSSPWNKKAVVDLFLERKRSRIIFYFYILLE